MEQLLRDMVGFQIKTISEMMFQRITSELAALDLTSSQAFLLLFLCRKAEQGEAVNARDVERLFRVAHPTVSGLLQRLVAKGFLTLVTAPDDRRCKQIVPTDRARQLSARIGQQLAQSERQLTAGFTPEEAAQLKGFLRRLLRNISPYEKKEEFIRDQKTDALDP